MTDWQPQVTRIKSLTKHPGADRLAIATVWDYPVCCKLGEFQEGDLVGYIPIDTIVPDIEEFYFLCPKDYEAYEENGETKRRMGGPRYPVGSVPEKYRRIKAKQMCGVYSQGMIVPCPEGLNEGDSLTERLNLTKWEEEGEENLPSMTELTGANAEPPPKGWAIPHYDIDGIRKYVSSLQEGGIVVLTEKVNGSNFSASHDGTRLWVKSRNFYKRRDEDDMWWEVAQRYDLENKLSAYPGLVFFGEVYGQVKGFRYDTVIEKGKLLPKILFFDVYDTLKNRYLDYEDRVRLITEAGLNPVPELYRGPWLGKEVMFPLAEGKTTLGGTHVREGWVLNTLVERFEPYLNSRMHVKLVGEGYNLQKK